MSDPQARKAEDALPRLGLAAMVWRLALRIAPREARARFRNEWMAELAHGRRLPRGRRPSRSALLRAALADAWWLRRNRGAAVPPLPVRLLDPGSPFAEVSEASESSEASEAREPSARSGASLARSPSPGAGALLQRLSLTIRVCRRRLLAAPLFSALFVLLLGGGIAAAATVYTVAHQVVFAPLPYAEPERLVRLLLRDLQGKLDWVSWAQAERLAAGDAFESVAASTTFPGTWRGPEGRERVQRSYVSASYFETLGVAAGLGELFRGGSREVDDEVVLAHGFWRSRLGGDEAVVGSSIEVDGRPRTVIGVAPAGLYGHDLGNTAPQLYLIQPAGQVARNPHFRVYTLFARVRRGQTAEAAAAELERATAGLALEQPDTYRGWTAYAESLQGALLGDTARSLRLLLVAVIALLGIVALNLSGLMASRALSRSRETALHLAIGSGRGGAAAQALSEGIALSLVGGLFGVALTGGALRAVASVDPALPRLSEIGWGLSTVTFAALATGGSAAVVLLATALLSRSRRPFDALRNGARSGAARRPFLRAFLISTQVALAVPLVLGASLLVRSLSEVRGRPLGIDLTGVTSLRVSRPPEQSRDPDDNARYFERLLERVEALPGTISAGAGLYAPLATEEADRTRFRVEGEPRAPDDEAPRALMQVASVGYFETLGTRVVLGRSFEARDRRDASPVALVNEELVRRSFPASSPLGRRLEIELPLIPGDAPVREIVGVVEDQAQLGPFAEAEPMIYVPHAQTPWPSMALVVRSPLDAEILQPALRSAVLELDAAAIVDPALPLRSAFEGALARPRGLARLLLAFAVAAVVVSALGLYAALSLQVAERAREIGLRMALGATRRDVARLFLLRGTSLTLAGLAPGALLALGLRRVLAAQIHGSSALDPMALGATLGVLTLTGLFAAWLPARRAARHDPVDSLEQP